MVKDKIPEEFTDEAERKRIKDFIDKFKNPDKDPTKTREFYEIMLMYSAVFTPDGKYRKLHSHSKPLEHSTIRNALTQTKAKQTLEIGFAYGTSALIFAEYHQSKKHEGICHTIIDPNQFETGLGGNWEGIGAENLKRVGFHRNRNWRLIEDVSQNALPILLEKLGSGSMDVIFVDGGHNFDHTLIDIFYCLQLLRVGGICIVDDKRLKAVKAVINYIKESYKHVVDVCPSKCQSHLVLKKTAEDLREWPNDEKINYNLSDK